MTEREDANGSPRLTVAEGLARLHGDWTLRQIAPRIGSLRRALQAVPPDTTWVLTGAHRFDSFAAALIWRTWGGRWASSLEASEAQKTTLEDVSRSASQALPKPPGWTLIDLVAGIGATLLLLVSHITDMIRLIGQLLLDLLQILRHPSEAPLKEISAGVYKMGVKAMPVAALVGFLIGVVLSYLSALQLKAFGADVFIVNILGLGIIRELGPVLVSILVAGRSGSAMTAQLGVMRVTEEIDALSAMGISRTLRLVLPKVIALTLAMPLLVLWTSGMALFGGMVAAWIQLDLSFTFFIETLPQAVPIANLYIGFFKGALFGLLIALIACHFGLRVKPNTESLSANTTASVVTAITMVILADAVLAIATRSIGVPL